MPSDQCVLCPPILHESTILQFGYSVGAHQLTFATSLQKMQRTYHHLTPNLSDFGQFTPRPLDLCFHTFTTTSPGFLHVLSHQLPCSPVLSALKYATCLAYSLMNAHTGFHLRHSIRNFTALNPLIYTCCFPPPRLPISGLLSGIRRPPVIFFCSLALGYMSRFSAVMGFVAVQYRRWEGFLGN